MGVGRRAVLAGLLAGYAAPSRAQGPKWPTSRMVFIVAASAGGSADLLARTLAQVVSAQLGCVVVVENRGGAGGLIAAEAVSRSPPDGSVFLLSANPMAILPALVPKMPYDSARDVVSVTRVAQVPHMVIVSAKGPYRTLAELVAGAKKGDVNYGTGGAGTVHHLGAEMFAKSAGVTMSGIHYRGSGPAVIDLISNTIQAMFESMPSAAAQIRGGTVRPLAIAANQRSAAFPDVPTIKEAGFAPLELTTWYALWGPRGLPPELAAQMAAALRTAQADPAVRAAYVQAGADHASDTPAEFDAFFTSERARWAEVVRLTGATLE